MAPLTRAESFDDDDLDIISSQAANISLHDANPPLPPHTPVKLTRKGGIFDLSNSPALASASSSSPNPAGYSSRDSERFGKGKLMSSSKQKATKSSNPLFYLPSNRPEHHRDRQQYASKPAQVHHPAKPQLFSSLGPDAQLPETKYIQSSYCTTSSPKAAYLDQPFYTDPAKADADLKALLEGGLDDEDDDEEGNKQAHHDDGTIEGIEVKLLPHQVEGVKWMKNRELGPVKSGKVPKGGILADDMGLGKTLQSISLILSNPRPKNGAENWTRDLEGIEKGTLVVAPLALIRQWEQEIKDKVSKSHRLNVCVHHGPNRTKRYQDLAKYDVVITTYQIVLSEHGNCTKTLKAGCFGLHWFRIILDEAHTIKNRNAKSTKACYELDSEFRWCLTGTPMQNDLDELQSLVRFLRISPYDDVAHWRINIDKPMKSGQGHIALDRLHALLRSFMKRRTKNILKEEGALLPGGKKALQKRNVEDEQAHDGSTSAFKITERKIVSIKTTFSPAERKFYDQMERRADESLEVMLKNKVNYANAFVLLLRLRQACNHPRLISMRLAKDKDALATDSAQRKGTVASFDELADAFGGMGIQTKKCEFCVQDLSHDVAARGRNYCKECAQIIQQIQAETLESEEAQKTGSTGPKKAVSRPKDKQSKGRRRNIILDSDDESENGTRLIGDDQQGTLRLGKAGGPDDENAEDEDEATGEEDSIHYSEDEDENGSRLDSFVVKDERIARQFDDSSSDDGGFVSVDKIGSQPLKSKKPSRPARRVSESEDDEEEKGIENSLGDPSEDDSENPEADRFVVKERNMLWTPHRLAKGNASPTMSSAKIREMIKILEREVHQHKFIIFSQFTSMLDLVEPYLDTKRFKYARYDGSMKNDAREESLHRLRNNAQTRILLCSLKCGSLGLNLTAATRVIIVEPFWNPFVEEQAIDRVHRLTQTIDVVVYKITVADTVEERILNLQEKKRLLAEHAIDGAGTGSRRGGTGNKQKEKEALKLSLEELLSLFNQRSKDCGGSSGEEGRRRGAASTMVTAGKDAVGYPRQGRSGDIGNSNNSSSHINGVVQPRQSRPLAPASTRKKEDDIYGRRW
ncbi:SNF2 family N-terminal domain-domain-containing protein [Coniella lustricola]|uniref:SNF2 family N-terminal domain-domain-containing protein n=1 Tax=Coniella lustricola TaxID=2025994 RepID=A0A2T3AM97_9PEZI|nr:SNF2 family N-terminal domain-domain-containing protein [Coniella lustricola]